MSFDPAHDEVIARYQGAITRAWDDIRDAHARDVHNFSLSALGECLRKGAYKLAKVEPSDTPEDQKRAAHLGTAVHDLFVPALAEALGGVPFEEPVTLTAGGITVAGRFDLYDPATFGLVDVKTVGKWRWNRVAEYGPPKSHLLQAGGYATALIQSGRPVEWLGWVYMHRENGAEQLVTLPWHLDIGVAVVRRVEDFVRAAERPDVAPREEKGPSAWLGKTFSPCDGCPWLTRCWGKQAGEKVAPQARVLVESAADKETAKMLTQYAEARSRISREEGEKKFAAAVLSGAEPGVYGSYKYNRTRTGAIQVTKVPNPVRTITTKEIDAT